jgi:hypothetical protein
MASVLVLATGAAPLSSALTPIVLHAGVNPVPNMAGDGKAGSIALDWRENGNAWGYHIYTVTIGGSIATVGGQDHLTDSPHTGEDMITAVRFARGSHAGHATSFALVATRKIGEAVPDPAPTTITRYALVANDSGVGTPYQFIPVGTVRAKRPYCNADMALHTELGLPLAADYDGARTIDGC